jgi:hypothetical protein
MNLQKCCFKFPKLGFLLVNRKKIERKFVVNRFVWTKICSGGKSSLVIDSFRCVQVRFHTKTMKNLVFFTKCPLMTGFRCGQSPLWTESVVDRVRYGQSPLWTESVVDRFYCIKFCTFYRGGRRF